MDLEPKAIVLAFISVAVVTYSGYVTWLVTRCDYYTPSRRNAQFLVVWLLPILGPVLVHWFAQNGALSIPQSAPDPFNREQDLAG